MEYRAGGTKTQMKIEWWRCCCGRTDRCPCGVEISWRISWRGTIIKSTGGGGCTTCALPTCRAPVVYPAAGGSGRVHEWLYTIFQPGGPTERTSLLLLVDWKPPSTTRSKWPHIHQKMETVGISIRRFSSGSGWSQKKSDALAKGGGSETDEGSGPLYDPPKGNSKET